MDVILDYAVRTYMSFTNEFDVVERGLTLYEPRTDPARARAMDELVARYDALPGVKASGAGCEFSRWRDGVTSDKEVYRVTLRADEADVRSFLEDARDLGYGAPEDYGPASISTPDAAEVRERLGGLVDGLETRRSDEYLGVVDTPRGEMRAWAARW